jgi:hypothetical protein
MSHTLDTFLLYYTAWRDGEFDLRGMQEMMLSDLGKEAYDHAVSSFGQKVQERRAAGIKKTIYDSIKAGDTV